jgi:hypothetical protein
MATPQTIQPTWKMAMKRDFPREQMPKGSVWNMVDYLPEVLNSSLRKRGGYVHESQDISVVQGSASALIAGLYAPYSSAASILVFDEDGRAYEVESSSSTENIGAALTTVNPVFYSDKVIVPDATGAAGPKKITKSAGAHTIANLAGTPPAGRYAVIYKDVLWLASSAAIPDRIYFSNAGDPETWDTTNKYLDASFPITGMAALQNAVFVFTLDRTMRVRGSVPPPDTDFIVDDPIFDIGCTDARSIATWGDKVIWANAEGLYFSDGTAKEDLTQVCGMKSWWRDVMQGRDGFQTGTAYNVAGFSIAGSMYGNYYFYAIVNLSVGLVDSGFIDMTTYTWHRAANIDGRFFFGRGYPEELYFCRSGAARLGSLSSLFAPTSSNKNDADGDAVLPVVEGPFFMADPGQKTMRRLYVAYDIRDAASDNPILTVSYIDTPEEASYTALTPTLTETTQYQRTALPLDFAAPGIGLKIAQTNASSDTRLYAVELEATPRERSR